MTDEFDILRAVSENPSLSQRQIAEKTGISLGQVNFLIKKCVKKGLIKIEGQTSKSIKYNLTPKGMTEKVAKTLEYVKISYGAIVTLTNRISALIERNNCDGRKIYICGDKDEIMEIIKLTLDNVFYLEESPENALILFWDNEVLRKKKAELEFKNCKFLNILE